MHSFDFDFRYYRTYNGQKLMGSGLYVFKTQDQDSLPYPHKIVGIQLFRGQRTQQLLVKYLNSQGEYTIVKIRLSAESKEVEFDVQFARLPLKENEGMDVTINWRNLVDDNRGVFYTDTNAYKAVKNDINR